MHTVSEVWDDYLKYENVIKPQFLVTLVFGHGLYSILRNNIHPATFPGAMRLCTGENPYFEHNGQPYFFSPAILEHPEITHEIIPHQKRVSELSAKTTISANANFPFEIFDSGGTLCILMRIDLALPGMDLSNVINLFIGQVTGAEFDRTSKKISLAGRDGDPIRAVRFPPGDIALGRDQFSQMPLNVAGRFRRTVALGSVTYPILCPQVDTGKLFYVCESTISPHSNTSKTPFTVTVNGENVSSGNPEFGWELVALENNAPTIGVGEPKGISTFLRFKKEIKLELPFVTCSGFSGLSPNKSPILTLLDYAQYPVCAEARGQLEQQSLLISSLVNVNDSVLSIVNDRLIPQTPYFSGFLNGYFTLFDFAGIHTNLQLAPGNGLYGRALGNVSETRPEDIYNAIDIGYHRNIYSDDEVDVSQLVYMLDETNATGKLAEDLKQSTAIYGRRYIKVDFPDVPVEKGKVPDIIKQIAHDFLALACKQRSLHTYDAPLSAIKIPLNTKLYLTDPLVSITHKYVRVVSKTYFLHKVRMVFQDENT